MRSSDAAFGFWHWGSGDRGNWRFGCRAVSLGRMGGLGLLLRSRKRGVGVLDALLGPLTLLVVS